MQLDHEPRDRSGRWMRRLALAFLIGSVLVLLDFGFMAVLKLIARFLR